MPGLFSGQRQLAPIIPTPIKPALRTRQLAARPKGGYLYSVEPLRWDDVPNVDSLLFVP